MLGRPSHKAPNWNAPSGKVITIDRTITRYDVFDAWDAGVSTSDSINGPCFVQFRTINPAGIPVVGLSHTDASASYDTVQYGFEPYGPDTFIYILENGVQQGGTNGNFGSGTVFRIEARPGQAVKYFVNDILVRTSTGAIPTFPLLVDTALNKSGTTVGDIIFAPLP